MFGSKIMENGNKELPNSPASLAAVSPPADHVSNSGASEFFSSGLPKPFQSYAMPTSVSMKDSDIDSTENCNDNTDIGPLLLKGSHQEDMPISPVHEEAEFELSAPTLFTSNNDVHSDLKVHDAVIQEKDFQPLQSPDGNGHFKYQRSVDGDIRHQLLVQRTFNNQEDYLEPRTSSPLRKIRICTASSGIQTVTVSPSSGAYGVFNRNTGSRDTNSGQQQKHAGTFSPFMLSPIDSTKEAPTIFKTPNRKHCHSRDGIMEGTPSHDSIPLSFSPSSTVSYGFTPGRQFVNPFEVDQEQLQLPFFSPNMFKVTTSASKDKKNDKEAFWSFEHVALIKPIDIKETEIQRQLLYQQRIDREQDTRIQLAVDKFFSNDLIAPSPWSEKVEHFLPCTPGTARSVSCQTTISVPPGEDLLAELGGKYQLANYKTQSSPASESMGNFFIRRKLLHQLNENDSDLFGSPALLHRTAEMSNSPSPGHPQTTPEWEKQTPNKVGSGHFSSSPIHQAPDERHHALSESDILASPELSPIMGIGKSVRSSGVFCSRESDGSPRPVMQLDFSSILDPDDLDVDRARTLVQKSLPSQIVMDSDTQQTGNFCGSGDHPCGYTSASHDSEGNLNGSKSVSHLHRTSFASAESANEIAVSAPQTSSNHDTGYQTASLQSTHQDLASSSNLTQQDPVSLPTGSVSSPYTELPPSPPKRPEIHSNVTEEFTKLKYNSSISSDGDGSFLSLASRKKPTSSVCDNTLKKEECFIRKFRMLSDMRFSKEKSSVSRDLTHSFNEELEKSDSNMGIPSSWSNPSPTSFALAESKPTPQGNQFMQLYPPVLSYPGSITISSTCSLQGHTNIDNAVDDRPFFNASLHKKGPDSSSDNSSQPLCEKQTVANIHDLACDSKSPFTMYSSKVLPRFSLEDDTLKQARLLLGKSEQLRQKLHEPKSLETDSLYRAIIGDVENQAPMLYQDSEYDSRPQTPKFKTDPVDASTPTSQAFSSLKKKIEKVEGSKLGSEIAAEILKRAGDDLAELTRMLQNKSPAGSF